MPFESPFRQRWAGKNSIAQRVYDTMGKANDLAQTRSLGKQQYSA
jgi:hypothetical protein